MKKPNKAIFGLKIIALSLFGFSAQAANLVANGGFELTTSGAGQLNLTTNATDWTTNGYNFLFTPGTADAGGAGLRLWGPANGEANGLANSPVSGNFIGADGAYLVGAISQTISGLTVGDKYTLGFWWAGAQEHGFTGPTTEQWKVKLGGVEQDTVIVNNASHGFTGWMYQTFDYTATSNTEVLEFLAAGTPNGLPPFSLLDGVTLVDTTAVSEPESIALLSIGLLGMIAARRKQANA